MGRAPIIVPGPPSGGLSPIGDLTAEYSGGNIILGGSLPAGADHVEAQFWIEGESERTEHYPIPADFDLLEGFIYNVHARGVAANGNKGPHGRIARFPIFHSAISLRDQKTFTYLGVGNTHLGVDLSAMTEGAIDAPVGSLLVLTAQMRSAGQTATAPTAAALQAGYSEILFPTPLSGATQEQQAGRAIYKVITGGEASVVPMINSSLGSNIRENYVASVFDFTGILELGDNMPTGQNTTGNPSAQTLQLSGEGNVSLLVMAFQSATSSNPATPLPNADKQVTQQNTTTVSVRSQTWHRILSPALVKENIVWDPADHGENSCGMFYFRVRPGN